MDRYPPTGEQLEERIVEFIDSIVDSAVCRLASKYNGQKPCSIVGSSRGSFNVCFFVQFGEENAKWVVRVPLEPVVVDPWAKVQSEAATMRYVFPICCLQVLELRILLKDTSKRRRRFPYQQFMHMVTMPT
jgi:hypothetical protein